jgi:hypothetical protein
MHPTNELRFVERKVIEEIHAWQNASIGKIVIKQVLQQKWRKIVYNDHGVAHNTDVFEWRDVPLEVEG